MVIVYVLLMSLLQIHKLDLFGNLKPMSKRIKTIDQA